MALRALGEFCLLIGLVHRLSIRLWGPSAGWPAAGLLASCALFQWGIAIEQETGLTALSLVAMVLFLIEAGEAGTDATALTVWAGVAAGTGALSREYGWYFVLLGLAALLGRGWRRCVVFLCAAFVTAGPWYLRNAARTGNPVYPALGALFPTNPVHGEIMGDIRSFWSFAAAPMTVASLPLALLATAGPVALAGGASLFWVGRRGWLPAAGLGLVACLCVWSMPLTAGGWFYALRVLLPALALGACLGGWVSTRRRGFQIAAAVAVVGVSADACLRSWILPDYALVSPRLISLDIWRAERLESANPTARHAWQVLVPVAAGRGIVVDSPQPHVDILALGGHPVPFQSPECAPLFDRQRTAERALADLRAGGIRFVTFSVKNPVVNRLVQRHDALRALADRYQPVADIRGLLIFDLDALQPRTAPLPAK